MMLNNRIIKIISLVLFCYIACYSSDSSDYPYKTKFNKTIGCVNAFIGDNQGKPVCITVDNQVVFKTEKDKNGDYEPLSFAGLVYAPEAAQIVSVNGIKTCYRWVVRVGWAAHRKYYIFDFTVPSPFVVGPFTVPESSDEVKTVNWGKTNAKIKFLSLREFKYYYKEKTVVED